MGIKPSTHSFCFNSRKKRGGIVKSTAKKEKINQSPLCVRNDFGLLFFSKPKKLLGTVNGTIQSIQTSNEI